MLNDLYLLLDEFNCDHIEFREDGKTYANNIEIDIWEELYKIKTRKW